MRIGLASILVIALIGTAMAAVQMADSLGVDDASGDSGESVIVPVNITNVQNGPIAGIEFQVLYNSSVISIASVDYGNLTSAGWGKTVGDVPSGKKILLDTDPTGANVIPDGSNGPVALLNFNVIGASGTSSHMDIINIKLADISVPPVKGTAPAKNGSFAVLVAPTPCFIATATYGTPLDENINVLRDFRDAVLMTNPIGEAFVFTYYRTSPPIAGVLRENEGLRTVTRLTLITPLVYLAKFALNGIWLVFIPGLAAVLLYRRGNRKKILKSLLVGTGVIPVSIATIFALGFVGYTIPFCAVVGAYMLPFVIPLSAVFTLGTLLRTDINVSDNIKRHARDSKM